jgi:hypothetical protein
MKKYIVLSVNDNCDYLYFTPLTCWAWRKFGWEPIVMYHGKLKALADVWFATGIGISPPYEVFTVPTIDGYRGDTITQISRLYASMAAPPYHSYLMTGDIDMIPLSDYWQPDTSKITVWGHDLTGFGHYPICYIGMNINDWNKVMQLNNFDSVKGTWEISNGDYSAAIKRDLDTLPQAKDPDFYKYWFSDQDLITARLNEYGKEKITFINRGQGSHGYARGRVDRGSGGWVLDQPELIDAHLMQQTHHSQDKIDKLMQLLRHVWPNEDFTWFEKYTAEFKKMAL